MANTISDFERNPARRLLGVGVVLFSAVLFASVPNAAKIAYLEGANPQAVLTIRTVIGALLLALYLWGRSQWPKMNWQNFRSSAVAGLALLFTSIGFMGAVAYIDVSLAALIFYFHPFLVAVVGHYRGDLRLSLVRVLLIGVALLGLGNLKDKESFQALVALLEKESEKKFKLQILKGLEKLTGHYYEPNPEIWKDWFKVVGGKVAFDPKPIDRKKNRERTQNVKDLGISPATEAAVENGLNWLKRHQDLSQPGGQHPAAVENVSMREVWNGSCSQDTLPRDHRQNATRHLRPAAQGKPDQGRTADPVRG